MPWSQANSGKSNCADLLGWSRTYTKLGRRRRGRKDDNANYFCKQICTIVFTVEFPWDYHASPAGCSTVHF